MKQNNKIMPIMTVLLSTLVSFGVSYWQDNKDREINLRPYITVEFKTLQSNKNKYGIVVRNLGKGAAIIRNLSIKIENDTYPKYSLKNIWYDVFSHNNIDNDLFNKCQGIISFSDLTSGMGIIEGGEEELISIPKNKIFAEHNQYSEQIYKLWERERAFETDEDKKSLNKKHKKYMYDLDDLYSKCTEHIKHVFTNKDIRIKVDYDSLNNDRYINEPYHRIYWSSLFEIKEYN